MWLIANEIECCEFHGLRAGRLRLEPSRSIRPRRLASLLASYFIATGRCWPVAVGAVVNSIQAGARQQVALAANAHARDNAITFLIFNKLTRSQRLGLLSGAPNRLAAA